MEDNGKKINKAAIGNHSFLGQHTTHSSRQPTHVQYTERHELANTRPATYPQANEHSIVTDEAQSRMGTRPVQNSRGNTNSDFGRTAHGYQRAPKITYKNHQPQFPRSMNTIGGDMVLPNAIKPSLIIRRTLPILKEDFVDVDGRKLVTGTGTRPETNSSSKTSNHRRRVHEGTKVQEVKYREDKHRYLLRKDTRNGIIMHSGALYSSPNTRQNLPIIKEEYFVDVNGQKLVAGTWPGQDLSSNSSNHGPRVHEGRKVQEVRYREDKHRYFLRKDARNENMHSGAQYTSPNRRQILPPREGWQHCKGQVVNHLFKATRTCPERNPRRNSKTGIRPAVCENSQKEKEIKVGEGLRSRKTENKDINIPDDHPINGASRKSVPAQEQYPQECLDVIDDHRIYGAKLVLNSNRNDESNISSRMLESDIRSGVCENSPEEHEIKFSKDLRPRKTKNKKIKNNKGNSIDGTSGNSVSAQEPYPQELFDVEKSGVTEYNWMLLYAKIKSIYVRLFGIICVLLFITAMKLEIV